MPLSCRSLSWGTVGYWIVGATATQLLAPLPAEAQHPPESKPTLEATKEEVKSETLTETLDATRSPLPSPDSTLVAVEGVPLQTIAPVSTQASDLLQAEAPVTAEPTAGIEIAQTSDSEDDADSSGIGFYVGSRMPNPTALQGPTRSAVVSPAADRLRGISIPGGIQFNLSDDHQVQLELLGGSAILGGDLSYSYDPDDSPVGVSVNIFNQRSLSANFQGGDRDVELPNGDNPWVHRLGAGVELSYDFAPEVEGAFGITYQRVSVRDDIFSSDLEPFDELGNRLTVSSDGQDDLLTLNLATQFDTRDSTLNPTEGTRFRFGLDQSIPLEDEEISFTQVSANLSQFIPLPLFGFTEGPRTLVLNLQGGHIFNDVPPYEAFSLGGASSVRGFSRGEVGSTRSYIQASAEYRFPIFAMTAFDEDIDVGGLLFVDYATGFDTQDEVIGEPGEVRDKPGEGLGFGLGLRAIAPFGAIRLEFGIGDDGGSQVYFNIGDRF